MTKLEEMCLAGHVVSSGATWCCNLSKGHDGLHDDGLGDRWDDPTPLCGATRGPRSKTRCELPPDHMVGRLPGEPVREHNHTGRSRSGRWYSWAPEETA